MPRVGTWNMQGGNNWGYMTQVLAKLDPDVLCLQECGNPPNYGFAPTGVIGVAVAVVNYGTASRPAVYAVYWWANGAHIQQSLAILSRVAVGGVFLNPPPVGPPAGRPILGLQLPLGGLGWTIGSLHAPSVFSATGPQIIAYGRGGYAGVAALAPLGTAWACLGDWNVDSGNLLAGTVGAAAANAPYATHQGGYPIDYLVTSNPMPGPIVAANYAQLPFASDHVPVLFTW